MDLTQEIKRFYLEQVPGATVDGNLLKAPCPICSSAENNAPGRLIAYLNPASYFIGYFRCSNRCVPGGFPLFFGKLMGIEPKVIPGYDPDREPFVRDIAYPAKNLNAEIKKFVSFMTDDQYAHFEGFGVSRAVVDEMRIGYNGRYLVYPYFLEDGNCYAARCVLPDRPEDNFWHGDEMFFAEEFRTYNMQ